MGKYTRVIGKTILIRLNNVNDRHTVDEWLFREGDDTVERGYTVYPNIFYIHVNGHHNPRRVASQIGSQISEYRRII